MTKSIQDPRPDGIRFEVAPDGTSANLTWTNPGTELPSSAIQIFANDSLGATTLRNVSVILCACANNATCIDNTFQQPQNGFGHQLLVCECPDFVEGDLCEEDKRACLNHSCSNDTVCAVNSSAPDGYTCTECQEGYFVDDSGKCSGMSDNLLTTLLNFL